MRDTVGRLGGDEFALILTMGRDQQDAVHAANGARRAAPAVRAGRPPGRAQRQHRHRHVPGRRHRSGNAGQVRRHRHVARQAGRARRLPLLHRRHERAGAGAAGPGAGAAPRDNDELLLHYQPKVNLHTGALAGVEALLRWQRPGFGLVYPAEFVPVLEDTGLVVRVGAWIIDAACRQIAAWLADGTGPVRVAVNVASRQFVEGDLEQGARGAGRHRVPPELLELELTETALMSNAERTITVLPAGGSASRWPSTTSAPAIPRWPTCSASRSTS
jgi:predicted signal transduction protein with EAL and GGDEF domain